MTTYRIQAPNCKTYEIDGPPGADKNTLVAVVLQQRPEAGIASETPCKATSNEVVGDAQSESTPPRINLPTQASTADAPAHNALTQYMFDGGAKAAFLGAVVVGLLGALGAAAAYRIIRGSWIKKVANTRRQGIAIGVGIAANFGFSDLVSGALWSNEHDIAQGLTWIFLWGPIFAGVGALLAGIVKSRNNLSRTIDSTLTPMIAPAAKTPPASGTPANRSDVKYRDEDAIWAAAANEIESGNISQGLWTRLLVENEGDEAKTRLAYIKTRVERMSAEPEALAASLAAGMQ